MSSQITGLKKLGLTKVVKIPGAIGSYKIMNRLDTDQTVEIDYNFYGTF